MYCNKCGEKIVDISKPCSTCGMYVNSEVNLNSVENFNKEEKSLKLVLLVSLLLFFIIVSGVSIIGYSSKVMEYNGSNYVLSYSNNIWSKSNYSDGEYLYLQYNKDSSIYLQISNDAIETNLNVEDMEEKEMLYSVFMNVFDSTSDMLFTNIMSDISPLDNSDYYYLSADFSQYSGYGYVGKVYFLHTSNGKTLTIMLNLNDGSISEVEEDVFDLFRNIEM